MRYQAGNSKARVYLPLRAGARQAWAAGQNGSAKEKRLGILDAKSAMNGFSSEARGQQTVRLAMDCETGELVTAESLLAMEEADFAALRREAMQARVDRRRGGTRERFRCAICTSPLYLSRRIAGMQNRWFVHDGRAEDCVWYEGGKLAPDQVKALVYRGQQEGREHRELKDYMARWLRQDPWVQDVCLEKTTFSEVVKGQWRRPDVRCTYRGLPLVFEIQLSYTFLSDVIARDEFYRREGTFVIWVFSRFDNSRAAVADEAFFNKRNLFVLDAQARNDTEAHSELMFSGYRQTPSLTDRGKWRDTWEVLPVGLREVQFPPDTCRPYFFDYEAKRKQIQSRENDARRAEEDRRWKDGVDAYREAALLYFERGHGDDERDALMHVVDNLQECSIWHPGFGGLRTGRFFGYHGVLAVLMSIRVGRALSYSAKFSVFQVIEAGLRSGSQVGKHAYVVLYLWAYKIYRPLVTGKQRQWLSDYARKVKRSLESGEWIYRRDTSFDEAVSLLFPELGELLTGPFGTDLMHDAESRADGA